MEASIRRSNYWAATVAQAFEFLDGRIPRDMSATPPRDEGSVEVVSAQTDSMAVDHLMSSEPTSAVAQPMSDIGFMTLIEGHSRARTRLGEASSEPGRPCLIPPNESVEWRWDSRSALLLRLPLEELERKAAEIADIDPIDLRFDGLEPVSPALASCWESCQTNLSTRMFQDPSPLESEILMQASLEFVCAAALAVFPNTAMAAHRLAASGRVAPAALRRAVAFMEANAASPITLTDISRASGITPRGLQQSFRRHYDTTPLAYLRRVRLENAHRDLQATDPASGGSVAEIAMRWGFPRPDRFASYYRHQYGVPPSRTLRT